MSRVNREYERVIITVIKNGFIVSFFEGIAEAKQYCSSLEDVHEFLLEKLTYERGY